MPGNANAIRAGRAFVELFADDSKLVTGLKSAGNRLKAWGKSIGDIGSTMVKLGGLVVAPLIASSKAYASAGAQLVEMSRRTGLSVEALSALKYAAGQSGVEMEAVETGVRKMQRAIVESAAGSKQASEAMLQLGLSIGDLKDLSPQRQFELIADRLSKVQNPTLRAAIAMQIFGRAGTELLPVIEGGKAGLAAYVAEAQKLGKIMSTEDAEAAYTYNQALNRLFSVLKSLTIAVGSAVAPVLADLAAELTAGVVAATKFLKEHKEMLVAILKFAAGAVAAGAGLMVIGKVVATAGMGFKLLSGAITAVPHAIQAVIGILKTVGFVLSGLMSPVGLIIAGLAGVAAYFLYTSGAAGKAADWMMQKWDELKSDALATFGGIKDALAMGDLGAAANIAWLAIKVEWTKGTGAVSATWDEWLTSLMKAFAEVVGGVQLIWENVCSAVRVAWAETVAFLSKTWADFGQWLDNASTTVGASLAKAWVWAKGQTDKNFDTKAGYAAIDASAKIYRQQAASSNASAYKKADADKSAAEKKAADDLATATSRILKDTEDAKKGLDQEHAAKLEAIDKEVKAAKDAWQNSIDAASAMRLVTETQNSLWGLNRGKGLGDLGAPGAGGGPAIPPVDWTANHNAIFGSFSGAAVSGAAISGYQASMLEETKKIAKNTAAAAANWNIYR